MITRPNSTHYINSKNLKKDKKMNKLIPLKNKGWSMHAIFAAALISLFAILTPATSLAQDAKVDKAEANFCEKLVGLITALNILDETNETGTYDEFTKAYNKTVKAWNKFVKSADKLEKVDYKESVNAYNNIVDAVNLIQQDNIDEQTGKKINEHIDNAANTISDLQVIECK